MNTEIFESDFWNILKVIPQTLGLSLLILLLSVILGTIFWKLGSSRSQVVKRGYELLVSYLRGVPLLIHLLVFYYAVPILVKAVGNAWGSRIDTNNLSPLYAVLISYTIYSASFLAEIIRGSFKSVGGDQLQAADALGYTESQSFWLILVPQALSDAVPKILNYYVLLIRQLSLAFLVSVVDIFAKAKLVSAANDRYIEAFCAAALIYWIVCVSLTIIFNRVEHHLRRFERRSIA